MSINNIHALPIWTEKAMKCEKRMYLPVFHVNPNEYNKKMGTHLLALVHQLELSANEEHHGERIHMSYIDVFGARYLVSDIGTFSNHNDSLHSSTIRFDSSDAFDT